MKRSLEIPIYLGLVVLVALLPWLGAYPVFVMKVMCFALFACAFNLLIGFTGLLSFGHAAFLGGAAYATGHALKVWGVPTGTRSADRRGRRRRAWVRDGKSGHPAQRHLLFDDYAGARADAVLLFPAGAVHGRRGWPAIGAAGQVSRNDQSRIGPRALLRRARDFRHRVFWSSTGLFTRRSVRS